jgi:CBS-domain-containing membrane protein
MTREVYAVAPETSLEVAGRLLYSRNITGAPVVDARGQAIGVVTAKDLVDPDRPRSSGPGSAALFRLSSEGCHKLDGGKVGSGGRVSDVMTSYVIAVGPDCPLDQVMQLMTSDDIHRVFVVDGKKQIIGIVSSMDVIRALLDQRRS